MVELSDPAHFVNNTAVDTNFWRQMSSSFLEFLGHTEIYDSLFKKLPLDWSGHTVGRAVETGNFLNLQTGKIF